MKYFYDTEFFENGKTIELISIGIVAEDGREYYAVNSDMPDSDAIGGWKWICENVINQLPLVNGLHRHTGTRRYYWALDHSSTLVKPKWVIRNEVREFLLHGVEDIGAGASIGDHPELWAWYAAYDHVVLAQLFGRMIDLPKGIPMWTNDLRQEVERLGNPGLPEQTDGEHNALADARHLKARFEYLAALGDDA